MKQIVCILILMGCTCKTYSQTPWAFTRYGRYPVSKETGVPQILIPLHTVTEGELSVPITLTYHTSGIKVDEVASWVGLGWDLNAGAWCKYQKGYSYNFQK